MFEILFVILIGVIIVKSVRGVLDYFKRIKWDKKEYVVDWLDID